MSFVNHFSGARVSDADTHLHMTLESDQEHTLVRAACPTLDWSVANGTTVLGYKKALALLFENENIKMQPGCFDLALLSRTCG